MWFVSKDSEKYKRPTKPTFIFLLLLKKIKLLVKPCASKVYVLWFKHIKLKTTSMHFKEINNINFPSFNFVGE